MVGIYYDVCLVNLLLSPFLCGEGGVKQYKYNKAHLPRGGQHSLDEGGQKSTPGKMNAILSSLETGCIPGSNLAVSLALIILAIILTVASNSGYYDVATVYDHKQTVSSATLNSLICRPHSNNT